MATIVRVSNRRAMGMKLVHTIRRVPDLRIQRELLISFPFRLINRLKIEIVCQSFGGASRLMQAVACPL